MPPFPTPDSGSRSFFAIGGPAFNGVLLVVLFSIVAFVVGSPTRDSLERAASTLPGVDAPVPDPARGDEPPARRRPATSTVDGPGTAAAAPAGDAAGGAAPAAVQPVAYTGSYGAWSGAPATKPAGTPTAPTAKSPAPAPKAGAPAPKAGAPAPKPGNPAPGKPRRASCDDFAAQPAAQAAFDADRVNLTHFDGDGDGRACEHLPGAPADPGKPAPEPTPPPIPMLAAVANPATKYYGLHTKDAPWWMGEVDHLTRLTGKAPNLNLFFSNFGERFPGAAVDASWNRGMTPVVTWEPIVPGSTVGQPRLRDVYEGRLDTYLDAWAADAAANDKPLVVRFAHEMNGDWYPWSEGVNGNVEGDYVKAWRHVHDRFEAAGADNVLWMWSVNRVNWLKTDIADYYPGDEYVDWVGLSGYYRSKTQSSAPTFESTFGATLDALRVAAPGKKVLLSEIAAGTDDTARVQWIRSTFDGMNARPEILGFAWFNDVKTDGDWRIQFSQATVDAFAAGVASDKWGSGVLPVGVVPGSRMTVPSTPGGSTPAAGPVDKG